MNNHQSLKFARKIFVSLVKMILIFLITCTQEKQLLMELASANQCMLLDEGLERDEVKGWEQQLQETFTNKLAK